LYRAAVAESVSKTAVSFEVAAAIVADAFGDVAELVGFTECTEGWFNTTYAMTLADGRRCVLKVAPPPDVLVLTYERDIMATEVAALHLVRACTTAPVPRVLWSDTSCRRLPSPLFVMEHCPGRLLSELRPTMDSGQQEVVDAQVAGFLRQLSSITHPTFGRQAPSAPTFTRWSRAFITLFDDALADAEAHPSTSRSPAARSAP
jgi:aminoglycoside phosphotransferase (APT) family kinase protein